MVMHGNTCQRGHHRQFATLTTCPDQQPQHLHDRPGSPPASPGGPSRKGQKAAFEESEGDATTTTVPDSTDPPADLASNQDDVKESLSTGYRVLIVFVVLVLLLAIGAAL
jgi:hypothetical protein